MSARPLARAMARDEGREDGTAAAALAGWRILWGEIRARYRGKQLDVPA